MKEFEKSFEIIEGATVTLDKQTIIVEGPKGKLERNFNYPNLTLSINGNNIIVSTKKYSKRDKTMFGTIRAHINNMMNGVLNGYTYKLKVCSDHFPMNVSANGNKLIVKNYLGEKTPREIQLDDGVELKVNGDVVEVSAVDKEKAGTNAAKIELKLNPGKKDRRIFQDGIYIFDKGGKEL